MPVVEEEEWWLSCSTTQAEYDEDELCLIFYYKSINTKKMIQKFLPYVNSNFICLQHGLYMKMDNMSAQYHSICQACMWHFCFIVERREEWFVFINVNGGHSTVALKHRYHSTIVWSAAWGGSGFDLIPLFWNETWLQKFLKWIKDNTIITVCVLLKLTTIFKAKNTDSVTT